MDVFAGPQLCHHCAQKALVDNSKKPLKSVVSLKVSSCGQPGGHLRVGASWKLPSPLSRWVSTPAWGESDYFNPHEPRWRARCLMGANLNRVAMSRWKRKYCQNNGSSIQTLMLLLQEEPAVCPRGQPRNSPRGRGQPWPLDALLSFTGCACSLGGALSPPPLRTCAHRRRPLRVRKTESRCCCWQEEPQRIPSSPVVP